MLRLCRRQNASKDGADSDTEILVDKEELGLSNVILTKDTSLGGFNEVETKEKQDQQNFKPTAAHYSNRKNWTKIFNSPSNNANRISVQKKCMDISSHTSPEFLALEEKDFQAPIMSIPINNPILRSRKAKMTGKKLGDNDFLKKSIDSFSQTHTTDTYTQQYLSKTPSLAEDSERSLHQNTENHEGRQSCGVSGEAVAAALSTIEDSTMFLTPAETAVFLSYCKEMPSFPLPCVENTHGNEDFISTNCYPESTVVRAEEDLSVSSIFSDRDLEEKSDMHCTHDKHEESKDFNVPRKQTSNIASVWSMTGLLNKLFYYQWHSEGGLSDASKIYEQQESSAGVYTDNSTPLLSHNTLLLHPPSSHAAPPHMPYTEGPGCTYPSTHKIYIPLNKEELSSLDSGALKDQITEAVKIAIEEVVTDNILSGRDDTGVNAYPETGCVSTAEDGGDSVATRSNIFVDFTSLPAGVQEAIRTNSRYVADRMGGIGTSIREGDVTGLRVQVADLVQLGGPEVSGIWASVKVCLGIATIIAGHAVFGAAMIIWGTGAIGGAVYWGAHREEVRRWIAGLPAQNCAPEKGLEQSEGDIDADSGDGSALNATAHMNNTSLIANISHAKGADTMNLSSPLNDDKSFHSVYPDDIEEYLSIIDSFILSSRGSNFSELKEDLKETTDAKLESNDFLARTVESAQANEEANNLNNASRKSGNPIFNIASKFSNKWLSSMVVRHANYHQAEKERGFSPVTASPCRPLPLFSENPSTSQQSLSWWQRYVLRTPAKNVTDNRLFESRVSDNYIFE